MRLAILITLLTSCLAQNNAWTSKQYVIDQVKEKNLHWVNSFLEKMKGRRLKTYESTTTYSLGIFNQPKMESEKYTFDENSRLRSIVRVNVFGENNHTTKTELDERGIALRITRTESGKIVSERKVILNKDKSISEIQEFQNGLLAITEKYTYKTETQIEIEKITTNDYQKYSIDLNNNGKAIKYTTLNKDNVIVGYSINEYDENGNNTYWKSIKNNEVDGETRWKYDSKNRVIEQIDFLKSEDNYSNHEVFQYDSNGEIVYQKTIDKWGDTVLMERKILTDTIISITKRNGLIERLSKSAYLSKNRLRSIKTDFGNRTTEFIYEYDPNGRITNEKRLTNGIIDFSYKYESVFKEDLCIQKKEYRDEKEYSTEKLTYEFF